MNTELWMWIVNLLLNCIATMGSSFMYKNTGFKSIRYLIASSSSTACWALFYFLGRLLNESTLVAIGVVMILFGFFFLLWFIRAIFGNIRNYFSVQIIASLFIGITIGDLILEGAQLLPDRIVFGKLENVGLVGTITCYLVVVIDYILYTTKKIKKENLKTKYLFFGLVSGFFLILTIILFVLYLNNIVPYCVSFIPGTIMTFLLTLLIIKMPSQLFLAPLTPQLFVMVSSTGTLLYSKKINSFTNELLLAGAITAINILFSEAMTYEYPSDSKKEEKKKEIPFNERVKIELIKLGEYTATLEFREQFFLIYLDRNYDITIQHALRKTARDIEKEFKEELNDIVPMERYKGIDKIIEKNFYFIPHFD